MAVSPYRRGHPALVEDILCTRWFQEKLHVFFTGMWLGQKVGVLPAADERFPNTQLHRLLGNETRN